MPAIPRTPNDIAVERTRLETERDDLQAQRTASTDPAQKQQLAIRIAEISGCLTTHNWYNQPQSV